MQCNVGKTDRAIRMTAGVVIIGAGIYYQSWWGAIGAVPLIIGYTRWCPVFQLFGMSTNKK
jgi:hypothetical protein